VIEHDEALQPPVTAGAQAFAALVGFALAYRPTPTEPAHLAHGRAHRKRVAALRAALATAGLHPPVGATLTELRGLASASAREERGS
jgi:hypothetical protein